MAVVWPDSNDHMVGGKFTKPLWFLLVTAVFQQTIMGGTFPAARYATQLLDPAVVAFFRFVISSIIFFIIAQRISSHKNSIRIANSDRRLILLLGFAIIILNQTLYIYGQKYTTVAHGGLLFATTPIFAYIFAIWHLGETWSVKKIVGIILAVIGAGVMIFERGFDFDVDMLKGDLLILVAVAAWGFYSVWGKPLAEKYGAFRVTAYALGAGSIMYFPFGLYKLLTVDLSHIDGPGWLSIFYLAIMTSVIGYSLWYWLLKYMEASKVAVLNNMEPIVAGVLGYLLLGEAITIPFIVATAIILAGVTITQQA